MMRVRACVVSAFAACAFVLAACAGECFAQARGADVRPPVAPRPQGAGATAGASEDFELDIAERRITEESFFASTSVGGQAGALALRVGVALGAERIDVLLRNVRGRVRFRGSLEALRRVLDAHGATAADPAPRREVP